MAIEFGYARLYNELGTIMIVYPSTNHLFLDPMKRERSQLMYLIVSKSQIILCLLFFFNLGSFRAGACFLNLVGLIPDYSIFLCFFNSYINFFK